MWRQTSERVEILIANERERQTYYGTINYQTKQFFVQEYDQGNSENTVKFLKYLRELNPESKVLIIWDGASYHKSRKLKEYLGQVNLGLEPEEYEINCVLLAPNAPEQNPVEDIWLQAKNYLRKFGYKLKSFALVKWFFSSIIKGEFFDFPKLDKDGILS